MSNDNLLGIGGFAILTGLSVHALRHYDEVDLLRPAVVDAATGYRRYLPEQVRRARLICALRKIDLPLDEVREVLDNRDPVSREAVLARHRQELSDRAHILSRMVRTVDRYIEHGVDMPHVTSPRIVQVTINVRDVDEARTFYEGVFGAEYNEEISSFSIGTWPGDEFFMLTVAHQPDHPGVGRGGGTDAGGRP